MLQKEFGATGHVVGDGDADDAMPITTVGDDDEAVPAVPGNDSIDHSYDRPQPSTQTTAAETGNCSLCISHLRSHHACETWL